MTTHEYYEKQRSNTQMATEKFKPTMVSQVIALACPGEEIASVYPPYKQMQYRLTNGLPWFASVTVAKKISQFQVGEQFRVCLREYAPGKTVLDVKPLAPVDFTGEQGFEAPAPPSNGTTNIRNGNSNGHTRPTTTLEGALRMSLDEVKYDEPEPDADDPGPLNRTNGHHKPASTALMTGQGQFLLERANELIDVFAAAHKYSTTAYNGTLSKEDIRALLVTVYINHSKGGR